MNIKGVVLAGGRGTRLMPITKVVGKHFLPVGDKPIIYYPLLTLKKAGITEITIVCGSEHTGQYVQLLGAGEELGLKLTYAIQVEPSGIAHGLSMAEPFAKGSKVALILGDNIFGDDFSSAIKAFGKKDRGAKIVIKEVHDPERFGVAEFNGDKIKRIIEKPKKAPSNWAVTGLYAYDERVFDVIKNLKPSARGEYEITDVNNFYIKEGTMEYIKAKKYWVDAGTFESLHEANVMVRKYGHAK